MKRSSAAARTAASTDWRADTLARVRTLISQAVPDAVEEVKWRKPSNGMAGVPVWCNADGAIICTGETYKACVKLTFPRGASLGDPAGLFNASLSGGTRRAIDLHEGDTLNARAFKSLVREAAAAPKPSPDKRSTSPRARKRPPPERGGRRTNSR